MQVLLLEYPSLFTATLKAAVWDATFDTAELYRICGKYGLKRPGRLYISISNFVLERLNSTYIDS